MINALAVGKDAVKKIELLGVLRADRRIVNHHAHRAAEGRGNAARDFLRTGKHFGKPAVHAARVGPALGLLGLELVELRQHIHRNAQVVFLKALERCRIVQQHIGIEHIVFDDLRGSGEPEILGLGKFGRIAPRFF